MVVFLVLKLISHAVPPEAKGLLEPEVYIITLILKNMQQHIKR
jgi:hypothetical protein